MAAANSKSVPSTYSIFLNLPVADIEKSIQFYTAVGFVQNKNFSDKNGVMMSWPIDPKNPTDTNPINVMLLRHEFFKIFINASSHTVANVDYKSDGSSKFQIQALPCLGMPSIEAIDDIASRAIAAGGKADVIPPQIHTKMPDPTATEMDPRGDGGDKKDAWMYGRNFVDLDGNQWETMFMDFGKLAAQCPPSQ